MGKAYRLIRPQLTVEDIMKIRFNPRYRLTTSPFGLTPEEYERNPPVYLGRAVSWKGVKGIEEVEKKNPRVAAGLRKAIKISKAFAGTYGTTIYNGRVYPKKAIEQKRWKEMGISV